jgi:hypothetical protein
MKFTTKRAGPYKSDTSSSYSKNVVLRENHQVGFLCREDISAGACRKEKAKPNASYNLFKQLIND